MSTVYRGVGVSAGVALAPALRMAEPPGEPDPGGPLVETDRPAAAARLRAAGGGARALEWVLDGMTTADPTAEAGHRRGHPTLFE